MTTVSCQRTQGGSRLCTAASLSRGHLQLLCLLLLLALAAGLYKLLTGKFEIEDLIEQLVITKRHVYHWAQTPDQLSGPGAGKSSLAALIARMY